MDKNTYTQKYKFEFELWWKDLKQERAEQRKSQ